MVTGPEISVAASDLCFGCGKRNLNSPRPSCTRDGRELFMAAF